MQFNRVFRSASFNLTQRELNNYRPAKTGIRVAVHKHENNEAVMSLFGSRQMAFKQDEITMNDINNELSRMSSRIISERIRCKSDKPLDFDPTKHIQQENSWLHIPTLQGENDHVNSRATNVKYKWVPKEEFQNAEKYYEKLKKEFDGKYKVEKEKEAKIRDGKFILVKTGDILAI